MLLGRLVKLKLLRSPEDFGGSVEGVRETGVIDPDRNPDRRHHLGLGESSEPLGEDMAKGRKAGLRCEGICGEE